MLQEILRRLEALSKLSRDCQEALRSHLVAISDAIRLQSLGSNLLMPLCSAMQEFPSFHKVFLRVDVTKYCKLQ